MEEQSTHQAELKMISDTTEFNERFLSLRLTNKYTDCCFKIENRIINCHKLILAASSEVFEAMFYGKFSHDPSNSILITDISYQTFELFINFIYTGYLKLIENEEVNCLISISYCAQKYLIEDLRKLCLKRLKELLNRQNIFEFLAKSFEYHLEDFIVACLYFFVDFIESGTSFCNAMLNSKHLSSQCFEFLAKNLLDYFGERDEILSLIKAWTIKNCHIDGVPVRDDAVTANVKLLNLENSLCVKLVKLKNGLFNVPSSRCIAKSFHRDYYKPVRPLIIERDQSSFDTNVSFKRFIVLKSLTVNSRLIPEHYDITCDINNQMYTENIDVEIFEKSSCETVYKERHIVQNVGYNESFKIKFNERMVLLPYHIYVIKITWNDENAIGYEYPRAIYSLLEKGGEGKIDADGNPQSIVQFYEYNLPLGSIIQGIFYDLIS